MAGLPILLCLIVSAVAGTWLWLTADDEPQSIEDAATGPWWDPRTDKCSGGPDCRCRWYMNNPPPEYTQHPILRGKKIPLPLCPRKRAFLLLGGGALIGWSLLRLFRKDKRRAKRTDLGP